MTFTVRNITPEELIPYRRAEMYAFGSWSDEPVKEEYLQNIAYDQRFAAFDNGRLIATYTNYPFLTSVRGVWKKMGGVAGVSCVPEYRRQGAVEALVVNGFQDMRQKGQPVSMLMPFRESFYAKFGYLITRGVLGVAVDSVSFAHHLPLLKEEQGEWEMVREPAVEMRPEYLAFVQSLPQPSTFAIAPERPDSIWRRRRKDWLMVRIVRSKQTEALAIYKAKGFAEDGVLEVREMYWRSRNSRDRLFAFFALHKEQDYKIRFKTVAGTNFQQWITQPPNPFKLTLDHDAFMVRVIDVVGALQDLPAAANGRLTLGYNDPHIKDQTGTYELTAENGRLQATRTTDSPTIHLNVHALSALTYGVLPLAELEHRGWITGLDAETRQLLQTWFPEHTIYNPYPF